MAKRIIIAVTNDLVTDQRVWRIARTLSDIGYDVVLVGRKLKNSPKLEQNLTSKRFKLWFNKGALFYANYNIRLFFHLLFNSFDAVLSNDLDTLLASYLASKLKRKQLIYDSHEYFTEVPELVGRKFQKNSWLFIEKMLMPQIEYCYTVSGSIAEEYNKKYGTSFSLIRNLPVFKSKPVSIKSNAIIYQGALNLGRGIELMIQTMQHLPEMELWVLGSGDVENELKQLSKKLNLSDRIKFFGRIPQAELHAITVQAKIGLSLEENMGKNYYYALPNKLFDYIQARIPMVVSDLPEMKKIVEATGVGKVLTDRNPLALADLILETLADFEKDEQLVNNLERSAIELCWENEKGKVIQIFNKALNP